MENTVFARTAAFVTRNTALPARSQGRARTQLLQADCTTDPALEPKSNFCCCCVCVFTCAFQRSSRGKLINQETSYKVLVSN